MSRNLCAIGHALMVLLLTASAASATECSLAAAYQLRLLSQQGGSPLSPVLGAAYTRLLDDPNGSVLQMDAEVRVAPRVSLIGSLGACDAGYGGKKKPIFGGTLGLQLFSMPETPLSVVLQATAGRYEGEATTESWTEYTFPVMLAVGYQANERVAVHAGPLLQHDTWTSTFTGGTEVDDSETGIGAVFGLEAGIGARASVNASLTALHFGGDETSDGDTLKSGAVRLSFRL